MLSLLDALEPKQPVKTKHSSIGRRNVTLESDVIDGALFDTKVTIDAGTLCFIPGNKRDDFVDEINAVIDKYKI